MGSGKARSKDGVYVALLRGINVGGKNMLPMQELAAIVASAGCRDVRTYIQSGNVVFCADPKAVGAMPKMIAEAINKRLGLRVPVVMRSAEEMVQAARNNPFLGAAPDTKALHVAFLAHAPTANDLATLDPTRSPPDEFFVRGRDVYLSCPNGVARTKLTNAYFDNKLKTTSTVRNWRTVLTLVEMTREEG